MQIFLQNRSLTVCSLYIPPDFPNSTLFSDLDSLVAQLPSPFLVLTDANAHHLSWGSVSNTGRGTLIADWLEHNNLFLLNSGHPTYLSSSGTYSNIDLSICSPEIASQLNWEVHFDNYNSDHFPLVLSSNLNPTQSPSSPHWNFRKADWALYKRSVELPTLFSSPRTSCKQVTDAIINAAELSIPKSTSNNFRSAHYWTQECTLAKREKNKALNRYNNHRNDMELWVDYKRRRAMFRQAILKAKRDSWESFVSSISSKTTSSQVWRKVKLLSSKPAKRTIVLKENNKVISNAQEIVDSLAEQFSSVTSDNPTFAVHKLVAENIPIPLSPLNNSWYNKPFSVKEFNFALSSCTSNSPGPDHVTYSMIKQLDDIQTQHLLSFFNYLYKTDIPEQWKEAKVIPILKPNKPSHTKTSYRPIALLSCLSKLMEKMVNRRLLSFLEHKNFFSNFQSGFRAGHSTYDSLCRLESDARLSILNREFCLAAFLDISKAFDSVWSPWSTL